QNKLWISGIPGGPAYRMHWSAAGDETVWDTNDFVDFREKDDKPIVALFGGSGLLAFKEDSTYRVNDSTKGAFQTIDWTTGCVGPLALAAQDGQIFVWSNDGLYKGDGFSRFVNIGDKLR